MIEAALGITPGQLYDQNDNDDNEEIKEKEEEKVENEEKGKKMASLTEGFYLTKHGKVEYKQDYFNKKLEESLGYNQTLFKSREEEEQLRTTLTKLEFELLISDR